MIKSLFRLSLSMITCFVQSLIKLCGLDWIAPDYSALSRRQKHIDIQIRYEYRRQWRKLHIGIDAATLQIRTVQLTTNNVSDSQILGDLLDQISLDEQIDSVYNDGAYDTKRCSQFVADRQAHTVIPSRKNTKPWKDQKISSQERNDLLGGRLWKKWSGYHWRSLVETKMHCIKFIRR